MPQSSASPYPLVLLLSVACVDATPSGEEAPNDGGAVLPEVGAPDLGQREVGVADLGFDDAEVAVDAADLGTSEMGESDMGAADMGVGSDPLMGRGALEWVATGFIFVEGPRWFDGRLLFSDIPADTIYELDASGNTSVFRDPSRNANGLAVDTQGRLLAAEHGSRRVSRTEAGGRVVTVAGEYMGTSLNSPNDIAVRSDGTIYFTDPEWGIVGEPQLHELDFNGLFRVAPNGTLTLEWSTPWRGHPDSGRPNGVVLSADERTLYMSEDRAGEVLVFDVASGGSLIGPQARWRTSPTPDGLAMDTAGNLYVATSLGIEVFAPSGREWGRIDVSEASNVTFGGSDSRDLYITAGDSVYRLRLQQEGLR